MIVLDSSAAVDYLVGRGPGRWVEEHLRDDPALHTPHLLDVEVTSALRALVARRELTAAAAVQALVDLGELALDRYSHVPFLARIWDLRRHVSADDAAYIALAEALDATLITTDLRLARTHGHRARIVAPE